MTESGHEIPPSGPKVPGLKGTVILTPEQYSTLKSLMTNSLVQLYEVVDPKTKKIVVVSPWQQPPQVVRETITNGVPQSYAVYFQLAVHSD